MAWLWGSDNGNGKRRSRGGKAKRKALDLLDLPVSSDRINQYSVVESFVVVALNSLRLPERMPKYIGTGVCPALFSEHCLAKEFRQENNSDFVGNCDEKASGNHTGQLMNIVIYNPMDLCAREFQVKRRRQMICLQGLRGQSGLDDLIKDQSGDSRILRTRILQCIPASPVSIIATIDFRLCDVFQKSPIVATNFDQRVSRLRHVGQLARSPMETC